MTRPLHLEFQNAFYHVTSRGDRRSNIFEDDYQLRFLEIFGMIASDYNWPAPSPGFTLPATSLPLTPTADDLAATEDITLTPAIKALAASLNNNPVKIYNPPMSD